MTFQILDSNSDLKPTMAITPEPGNSTIFYSSGEEVLRLSKDGFWVKGVKVKQDDKEAEVVYTAFRQWLVWQNLTHE